MVKNLEGITLGSADYKMSEEFKVYAKEEVIEASTKYFKGDGLAATVWERKYALKDERGNILEKTPDDMHKRLAKEIARIENNYLKVNPEISPLSEEKIYEVMKDFKYIVPQGGPMAGIGDKNRIVSLSNCFVVGNESDSYGGIMLTDQQQVQLMKRRGGVGHDLSHIRPTKSLVKNSAQTSTGIVPFMERYSNSTREVAQGGRRGALMLSISIRHPDAEDFIDAKLEKGKVTGANVSVKIDDEFMKAALNGEKYLQKFPIDSENPQVKKEIDANKLWKKIVHNAWKSAEPGILFWDTITKESVPDVYSKEGYKSTSTNPCGEIPLCPYDSCRLLAINLNSYVEKPFTSEANFNFELFKKHTHYAQRIMDDIVDLEGEKINQILEKIESDPEDPFTKLVEKNLWERVKIKNNQGRRTGIGITGEGDMLAALGMRYGSEKAIDFSTEVHKTLALEAYRSSVQLARERGAFEIYDAEKEKDNPFINRIREADPQLYQEMVENGRRNIALLTIAPTGTTSMMTQTTSGIENIFSPVYGRRVRINPEEKGVRIDEVDEEGAWQINPVFHHKFKDWLEIKGYDFEEVKKIANDAFKNKKDKEKQEKLETIVSKSPYYKTTSADVDWVSKVKMQGEIQKWVDHSISVTVNLPPEATEEIVSKVYEEAWKAGCKGVTIYREGSRKGILSSSDEKEKIYSIPRGTINNPTKLPSIMPALRIEQKTPFGNMAVFPVFDPSNYEVLETYGLIGNSGGREAANMEEIGRLTSLWQRSGGKLENIIEQLKGIGSGKATISRDGEVSSLGMGWAKSLIKYLVVNNMIDPLELYSGKVDLYKLSEEVSDKVREARSDWKKYLNGNNKPEVEEEKPLEEEGKNKKNKGIKLLVCEECGKEAYDPTAEGCGKCLECGYSACGGG